jgi:tRNA/tmRNA/rRNA uracil-C5-methylase (TrmA/RlmC/RlmD family)
LELRIEDVAFGGKGVARNSGKAIFIPYTIDGERVSARIVREKKHFAEAELEDLLDPSPHRVTAKCPYFGRCGGCVYQHISYEHQLEIKARQVDETLRRIGHFTELPMRPIVASPQSYEYRNRITVHSQDSVIGFYRRDEHRLIDIERCAIAMPEANDELKKLRARHPRDGHYTLRAQTGRRVFSQTNDAVAERLLEHVTNLIPERGALLIDAYCGAGFFAKHLLEKFDRIVGIDWDVHAIANAQENASDKEVYIAGDVDAVLQSRSGALQSAVDLVRRPGDRRSLVFIVDPPASGLTNTTRHAITDLAPDTLIYISCNPATLARDLAELHKSFTIESVTPFDMFPQTAEIEVAVKLQALQIEHLAVLPTSRL